MNAIQALNAEMTKKNSRMVVGLDPEASDMPDEIRTALNSAVEARDFESAGEILKNFCIQVIDAVHDIVPAVKPNAGFFEKVRALDGAFYEVCAYAKSKGLKVIADVKRGDIGNTAKAYATSFFGYDDYIDFVTLQPYMGSESTSPFLQYEGRGAFLLVRTSNPSGSEIQELVLDEDWRVYQDVAKQTQELGKTYDAFGYTRLGIVVGATNAEQGKRLRADNRESFFLIPGVGTQGGGVKDAAALCDMNGEGAIINISRGVLKAWQNYPELSFEEAVRKATIDWNDQINKEVMLNSYILKEGAKRQVMDDLIATGAISVKDKGLHMYTSGKMGPHFVNSEFLLGSKEKSKEVLAKVDELLLGKDKRLAGTDSKALTDDEKKALTDSVLQISKELYENDKIYRNTIDLMVCNAKEIAREGEAVYISGGERRDWIFSILVAKMLDLPHIALFKNNSPYAEDGQTNLGGANVLHVADLINTASSYGTQWLPQIDEMGGKMTDTLVVNIRVDDGGKEVLKDLGIKATSLVDVDEKFFKYAYSQGAINADQLSLVEAYMQDPLKTVEEYIQTNQDSIIDMAEKGDKKTQDKLQKCFKEGWYQSFNSNSKIASAIGKTAGQGDGQAHGKQ